MMFLYPLRDCAYMTEDGGWARILTIVRKGWPNGNPYEAATCEVLVRAAAEVLGTPCSIGRHTMCLVLPDRPGDPAWMKENVFRFEDGVPVTPSDRTVADKVARLVALMRERDPDGSRMGWDVLKRRLDEMMTDYDFWVVD